MKRLFKLLVYLYPPSWRKRYGAEFDALLEDSALSARDAFDVFWGALKMQMTTSGFVKILLACSAAEALLAITLSLTAPRHFVSETVVIVTPAGDEARRLVDDLGQKVASRESLAPIIQKYNLYAEPRLSLEAAVERMKRNIHIVPVAFGSPSGPDTITFAIRFDYADARVAQRVNEELTSRLMQANLHSQANGTFRVPDPPTLPLWPASPNRTQFALAGLCAGLLAGLALTLLLRSRRTTIANR